MGDNSKIEWTDATWNPIRAKHLSTGQLGWHCEKVSAGCRGCYAERLNLQPKTVHSGTSAPFAPSARSKVEVFLDRGMLLRPLSWRRPRKIFVCSMTDLFAPFVADDMIDPVFDVAAARPQHIFQILTKRPARMQAFVRDWMGRRQRRDPLPNVWCGTSTEDQPTADARVPYLLATPAAVHFVSGGPLLGPIDFRALPVGGLPFDALGSGLLDWIIAGGESGPNARPMHPDWVRGIRDQCEAASIPFFFKQWGEWAANSNLPLLTAADGAWTPPNVAWPDGSIAWGTSVDHGGPGVALARIGKKRAGRQLDGVEHNAAPKFVRAA